MARRSTTNGQESTNQESRSKASLVLIDDILTSIYITIHMTPVYKYTLVSTVRYKSNILRYMAANNESIPSP